MKADRENKGNRKSSRFFQATAAAFIFIVIAICGGGCSSNAMMNAPVDESSVETASVDFSSDFEASELESEVVEDSSSISQTYTRVGQEIFKVNEMLFAVSDSINNIGK